MNSYNTDVTAKKLGGGGAKRGSKTQAKKKDSFRQRIKYVKAPLPPLARVFDRSKYPTRQ